jgi:hypothetical protein
MNMPHRLMTERCLFIDSCFGAFVRVHVHVYVRKSDVQRVMQSQAANDLSQDLIDETRTV